MPPELKKLFSGSEEVPGEDQESDPERIAEVRAQLRNLGAREKRPLSRLIRRARSQSRENDIPQGAALSLTPSLDTLRAALVGDSDKDD